MSSPSAAAPARNIVASGVAHGMRARSMRRASASAAARRARVDADAGARCGQLRARAHVQRLEADELHLQKKRLVERRPTRADDRRRRVRVAAIEVGLGLREQLIIVLRVKAGV